MSVPSLSVSGSPKLRDDWREQYDRLTPEERAEFDKGWSDYNASLEENPLQGYDPHPKQRKFHEAQTRVKAFIAGNRTGKTLCGCADDLIQALPEKWVPAHLLPFKKFKPPFKCRIFTPDLTGTLDEIQDTYKRFVPPSQLLGGTWDAAYSKSDRILRFENGSLFDFFSYDQDLDKLGSVSRHRIRYDEEPPQGVRKASRKRIIDTGGDEVFTFTPELGISWSYGDIYERRLEDDVTVVQAGMYDNPYLSRAEIDAYVRDLTDDERKVALYGEYINLGGIFYPEFSEEHLVAPPTAKHVKEQDIVCAIDPGLRTMAAVYVAFDNDNAALAFDEIYTHNELPEQMAARIKERNRFWSVTPQYTIDPSARNRATVNAEQVEAAFTRAGIYCTPAQNERSAGILEVKRRLQQKTLLISRDCQTLRWEFPRYSRDPKSDDEWKAIKVDDHGLDCLRYACMERAWHLGKQPRKRKPDYSNPLVEPPWRGPTGPKHSPPLGVFS